MKEQDEVSTTRIKPPRQVSQPIYIKFEDLEAFQEVQQPIYKTEKPPHGI